MVSGSGPPSGEPGPLLRRRRHRRERWPWGRTARAMSTVHRAMGVSDIGESDLGRAHCLLPPACVEPALGATLAALAPDTGLALRPLAEPCSTGSSRCWLQTMGTSSESGAVQTARLGLNRSTLFGRLMVIGFTCRRAALWWCLLAHRPSEESLLGWRSLRANPSSEGVTGRCIRETGCRRPLARRSSQRAVRSVSCR